MFLIVHVVERKGRELSADDLESFSEPIDRAEAKQSHRKWEQGLEEEKEQRGWVLLNCL